jgi:hypothetical protein
MLDFIFGWDRKIRKIRKRWDRLREKSLKKKEPIRSNVLAKLDQVENNLRVLEERKSITRVERARIAKEIEIDLEGVKAMVKTKEEDIIRQQQNVRPVMQKK